MLLSILISVAVSVAFALLMQLLAHGRERETDPSGRPVLRYLAAPYLMLVCATVFLSVAIYQWLDPVNHRHSGNLLLLSYIPGVVGLFALGMTGYYLTYRATLTRKEIEVYRWPLGHKNYPLADLERVEAKEHKTVLHFSSHRKFAVYNTYSGRAHFLSALSANNSLKPNPRRGSV